LRALITSQALAPTPAGRRNLAADLAALRSARVIVSVPDSPVLLTPHRAAEVLAAVRQAVRNVEQHAGPAATAWVFAEQLFAEELGDHVAVTVRDDGAGIRPGRLDEAAAEGRIGVAESIRGRVADLGGRVRINSAPGEGTEVEITVPVDDTRGPLW
jgi:signal transduction histidine kinase